MSAPQSRLKMVKEALQAGRRREARALLQQALRENPEDYHLWLWLAGLTPSPRASLNYLAQAERLRPGDPTVARARAWARRRLAEETTSQAASEPAPAASARAPVRRPRRRPLAWVAGGLAVLVLFLAVAAVAIVSGFTWDNTIGLQLAAGGEAGGAAVAGSSAGRRGGQFEPRNPVAVAAEIRATPTATATAQPPLGPKITDANKAGGEPRATWTMTPTPTDTPSPTPTPVPTFVSETAGPQPVSRPAGIGQSERWVDVNLTSQTLVAYEGDTPVFESLVSSGTWNHPTVTGQFRVWVRYQSQTMDGRRLGYDYYLPNVPYVMYFYKDYALHGTYWHNNFGTPMSHGCVNLPTPAAEWIFNWSTIGTVVNVHY